jgi:vanillate O-demethylase ferredoxin subunit
MRNNLSGTAPRLRAQRDLSASVREFEIRPEGGVRPWSGQPPAPRVRVDGREEKRSYSLVGLPHAPGDAPGADEVYRIAVRRAEPGRGGSRWLWGLQTGDELLIGEPNNHFEIGWQAPYTLLVAGGIGITPILGMALQLAQRGAPLRMLYAARCADELIYRDTLQAALGERLCTLLSDAGQRIDLDAEIAALPSGGQLALCGPLRLMDAARAAWQRSGRPAAGLRFETFGNSGHLQAAPLGGTAPPYAEVPADRSLDMLEEHGAGAVRLRRGECGLKRWTSSSCRGTVDHRDVATSGRQKQSNAQHACVSRVSGNDSRVVLDSPSAPIELGASTHLEERPMPVNSQSPGRAYRMAAVSSGSRTLISGRGDGRDRQGGGHACEQAEQVLRNGHRAAAGAQYHHIVKMVYVRDLTSDKVKTLRAVRQRHFGAHQPTNADHPHWCTDLMLEISAWRWWTGPLTQRVRPARALDQLAGAQPASSAKSSGGGTGRHAGS